MLTVCSRDSYTLCISWGILLKNGLVSNTLSLLLHNFFLRWKTPCFLVGNRFMRALSTRKMLFYHWESPSYFLTVQYVCMVAYGDFLRPSHLKGVTIMFEPVDYFAIVNNSRDNSWCRQHWKWTNRYELVKNMLGSLNYMVFFTEMLENRVDQLQLHECFNLTGSTKFF